MMDINAGPNRRLRCAIYTRKSSEEGLNMEFNSLDAQREVCEDLYRQPAIRGLGCNPRMLRRWGFSGGTLERPGLK